MLEVGQRVKVTKALDKDKEGEIIKKHIKSVPPKYLQVGGGDDKPMPFCNVRLDDGHVNLYPDEWLEVI